MVEEDDKRKKWRQDEEILKDHTKNDELKIGLSQKTYIDVETRAGVGPVIC